MNKNKIEEVKTIINLMVKTFSQMKIFSSSHENVTNFTNQLFALLTNFLQKYWKLEIGIQEFSFSLEGSKIYTDKQIKHSLPFLFYKDGMRMLFFYKNLKEEEFIDFLEIIKFNSSLPAEESDIVISFWEHDFTHIRYFAPDDYLESKIGTGIKTLDYQVDKTELFSGKIKLLPEDKEALSKNSEFIPENIEKGVNQTGIVLDEISSPNEEKSPLNQKEIESLDQMLQDSRKISREKELISLLFEMLHLEKRSEHFSQTLEKLKQLQQNYLEKYNFKKPLFILKTLNYFKQTQSPGFAYKKEAIDKFINSSKDESALAELKKIFQQKKIHDFDAYLLYLEFFTPATIPLFAYLYGEVKSSLIRDNILNIIKKTGKQNISFLMKIASDDKPELTKEIISILGQNPDKETVKHLAGFFRFKNKYIQNATINTLGKLNDRKADKILLGYLSETDEELRIEAIKNLDSDNKSNLTAIIQIVLGNKFWKKNWLEKKALMDFLSRVNDLESCSALFSIIQKAGMFSKKAVVKTSLYAVNILNKMNRPEAKNLLNKNKKSSNKRVRKACRKILQNAGK